MSFDHTILDCIFLGELGKEKKWVLGLTAIARIVTQRSLYSRKSFYISEYTVTTFAKQYLRKCKSLEHTLKKKNPTNRAALVLYIYVHMYKQLLTKTYNNQRSKLKTEIILPSSSSFFFFFFFLRAFQIHCSQLRINYS